MYTLRLIGALLGIAGLCPGQTANVYGARGGKFSHACPPSGKATISGADLVTEPGNLDSLIYGADLVVRGTVQKVLPSFNPDPDNATNIWTESVISIKDTLRGTLRAANVAVEQQGGKTQFCEEVDSQDPLMKVGEQYVLFLVKEKRTAIPKPSGLPLYAAFGVWAGKPRIVDQKITFLPEAHKDLHVYDGTNATEFITLIRQRMDLMVHAPR